VIHRDVKPENLFITAGNKLKVADFGIAKGFGDASITMTGSMGGTPYYMSPEQITDFRSVDYRTDLYALGCVGYELFTGRVPFHAEGLTQLLMLHLETAPPALRDVCPELPSELDEIILGLLEKVPQDRPRDCHEVATKLTALRLS
jgi:serine/threonine protein kinase